MSHFEWEDVDINAGNMVFSIISNIDYDNLTADIEGVGTNIPIHYHCEEDAIEDTGKSYDIDYPNEQDKNGAFAFHENDEVLVMFRRRNNEDPVIVGFPGEAQRCAVGGLFSIVYRHNGENYYLAYDPVSMDIKREEEDEMGREYYSSPSFRSIGENSFFHEGEVELIVSMYDKNDTIWIFFNELKWEDEYYTVPYMIFDHVFNSGFNIFSIPGEALDVGTGQAGIFLSEDSNDPDSFHMARFYTGRFLSEQDHYNQYQEIKWTWTRDLEDPSNDEYVGTIIGWQNSYDPDDNWMSRKWQIGGSSSGDWTIGPGEGGEHFPVRGWGSAYGGFLLYEHDYSPTEFDYGPYIGITDLDWIKTGFGRASVTQNNYPGTEASDDFDIPYVVPLSDQIWYGCCSSIVGIIDCRPAADCGYPSGPLHCSGSYCPSYTCYWHYSVDAEWGYEWRTDITIYGDFTSTIGETESCNAHWEATPWQRMKFGSAPWLCPASQSYPNPPTGLIITEQTCNYTYDHTKTIIFDASIPIYLVIENPSGSGTQVWDNGDLVWTEGTSWQDYYAGLMGLRSATLYVKDDQTTVINHSCEADITSIAAAGRGHINLGGKIFAAWSSSGQKTNDNRNDHTLIFYDIPGERRFIGNGMDVTTRILDSISGLDFMEGEAANIDNVRFVATRFTPSIARLRGH